MTDQTPQQEKKPGNSQSLSETIAWYTWFLPISLLLLVLLLFYFMLPILAASGLIETLRALFILVGGLMPAVIYASFIHGRLPILFAEYKQNLRRLGYPENAQLYKDKFDATYGTELETSLSPLLHAPIFFACLLASIGWLLVFYPQMGDGQELLPNPNPVAYGFLGAYIFGMGSLVRQYVTDDLQLRYYASMAYRFLVVFVLSWLITLLIPATNGPLLTTERYLLAAFTIGLFPTTGLRIAQRAGTAVLGVAIKGFREPQPLTLLDGLNAYHEDRLLLEGIESLQNLTCAKIVDLMLKTRYPVEQIVDWIDQALLHLHARGRMKDFHRISLRTATDFLDTYEIVGVRAKDLAEQRENLARLFDNHPPDGNAQPDLSDTLALLDTLAAALSLDPNLFHVRHWRDHQYEPLPEDLERARTLADLRLMQGIPDEAIEGYNELLRTFPTDHTTLLYRGLAYFALGEYDRAINDYTTAIERGGPMWEGSRHAYVERGRALRELREYEAAVQNYEEALTIYGRLPEARLDLAFVLMTYLGRYDEAIEHLVIVVAEKFKEATALTNLALARHERWKRQGRLPETQAEELGQAHAHLERALHLKPDLIAAYINLANVLEDLQLTQEAIRVLTEALQKRETAAVKTNSYRARLHRGNLYLKKGDYQAAVDDYRPAIELVANDAAAFYNLGIAQQQLNRLDAAEEAFRDAARLNLRHVPALQSLGDTLFNRRSLDEAEATYSRVLYLTRQAGDRRGQALAHLSLGRVYRQLDGRDLDARRELNQAIRLADQAQEDLTYTRASYELGLLHLAADEREAAIQLLTTSAELFDVLDEVRTAAEANLHLSRAHLACHDSAAATAVLQEARRQLATVFIPLNAEDARLQKEIEYQMALISEAPLHSPLE